MSQTSVLRKRLLAREGDIADAGAIDIASCATVGYSSEDPAHPIENLLDDRSGPGGTRWAGAHLNATEQLIIEFDEPQAISRLVYEVEETRLERNQQVRVEVSCDAGRTYRQLLAQDYSFSPHGATFQREEVQLRVGAVTHLRLTIAGKTGSGQATLASLRLFR